MNKYLFKTLFLVVITCVTQLDAQFRTRDRATRLQDVDEKTYSWGFYLNVNNFDYKLDAHPGDGMKYNYNLVSAKANTSFGAGLILRRKVHENIDLRLEPGLQFVQRELTWEDANTFELTTTKVKATYFDIPALIEFHGDRWYNSRPYAAVGGNLLINIQANQNGEDASKPDVFRSKTMNIGLSGELGIQLYFSKFKLTPAFRATFMLNDEIERDNPTLNPFWAGSLTSMKTSAFMFILKFE